MSVWAAYPTIYEINTWIWLTDLSRNAGTAIDLSRVPASEWDALAAFGFDAVWFMGVWERSPAGIAIANRNESLLSDFRRALPDFTPEDNVGSAYSIRRYVVDPHLGGPEGLAAARHELAARGMKLLLDFVPNHVAPDHPWITEHPEYLICVSREDARNDPSSFINVNGCYCACGRDPFFPAWPDVIQLNAFAPGLRREAFETVSSIAAQCDGIRCDMAMLLLNDVFARTWGSRAGEQPGAEYWGALIPAIKRTHPDFCFIAEAYWDMEWELQQQGFDFCYDKRLYDRLEHSDAESVRLHLSADLAYQQKLLRFLENHDEPRAAEAFSPARERAAAVVTSTLPGARMFHEGQLEGRKVKPPTFMGRRPAEPADAEMQAFYTRLLAAIDAPVFRGGEWKLCEGSGWPDNESFQNLVAWCWAGDGDRRLIAVNLSGNALQARVHVPWDDVSGATWKLTDAFTGATYDREGDEMNASGLYIELAPWGYLFCQCKRG